MGEDFVVGEDFGVATLQSVSFTALALPLHGESVHHLHTSLGLVLLTGLMCDESKFQTLVVFLDPSSFNF